MQERVLVQMFTKTLELHTHHVAVIPGTAPFLKLHYSVWSLGQPSRSFLQTPPSSGGLRSLLTCTLIQIL